MSEWQIELARTRTRISLPCGGASRSVSMESGPPKARQTAARISIVSDAMATMISQA